MISMQELNPHNYPLTEEISYNINILLEKINKVRESYAQPMIVTSGLRSQEDQTRINPTAPKSKHITGQACDIQDLDGRLLTWVLANFDLMKDLGFWFEDFRYTSNWIHFQIVPPASGRRVFIPAPGRPLAPARWDAQYDHDKYD
jgi:hypothetical protein